MKRFLLIALFMGLVAIIAASQMWVVGEVFTSLG